MRVRIANLLLGLDEAGDAERVLVGRAAERLGVPAASLSALEVARRSLDARGRHRPRFVVTVVARVDPAPDPLPNGVTEVRPRAPAAIVRVPPPDRPPVIVGAGPAGMFCALALVRAGVPVVLVDRGRRTAPRKLDVARLYKRGELDPDSNVSFGEGGAGTFTDGKLSTRVRDPEVREVLETLVEMGADPEILVTNKPHLGSEKLPAIVATMAAHLESLGCELRYETRVADLTADGERVTGVALRGGGTIDTASVVLAPGNAARELYRALAARPGLLSPKPLAMGLRVEHPQALVDEIQYGKDAGHPALPPADYKLAATGPGGRGVYAFCMCPGGVVVPTPTVPGLLCINGMSGSRRASRWANSALVAQVGPADFARAGFGDDVLAGMRFQEDVEARAFEAGGGGFRAPAQGLVDLLEGRVRPVRPRSSYPRGLVEADLRALYPGPVGAALVDAVRRFGRTMRGFVTADAVLIGAETRTSAPVTVARGPDLVSPALRGLYPTGEGCGHAGGIVSAAIDGLRVGRRIVETLAGAGAGAGGD